MTNSHSFPCTIYGDIALSQACRILGLGDRDDFSPHYGCFDRYFWHYKQVDFVNARFQESCHFLALLYRYNHPSNRFHHRHAIYDWAASALKFWSLIQRPDGSFDEYWPFERSFCVTSFTLYAAAETCRLLECPVPSDALNKAARWLSVRENPQVMNQMAASAVALHLSAVILEDEHLQTMARRRVHLILEKQHPTGYFEEYGGYDIGYQTITLSCLSQYYLHNQEEPLRDAIHLGFRFLDDKLRENGTYDNRQTSRKTQYLYPFGFRVMEERNLLNRHIRGLQNNEVINPAWCDDRYCLPLAIDYLQTAVFDIEKNSPLFSY